MCAQPSSSTCAHVTCSVVAQKVPSFCIRWMYDTKLGVGDEQGEDGQGQNLFTSTLLIRMQEEKETLLSCSASTLHKQPNLLSWDCLQANPVQDEEGAQGSTRHSHHYGSRRNAGASSLVSPSFLSGGTRCFWAPARICCFVTAREQ